MYHQFLIICLIFQWKFIFNSLVLPRIDFTIIESVYKKNSFFLQLTNELKKKPTLFASSEQRIEINHRLMKRAMHQ